MTEWWAQVTYPSIANGEIDDAAATAMAGALPGFGIVTATPAHTIIEMTLNADSLSTATAAALAAAADAWAARHGDSAHEAAGLRVITAAERDRELAHPDPIDLVGVTEIADRLGVTRQRASAITERADFPKPIGTARAGRYWTAESVDRFNDQWQRTPGRPRSR